MAISLKGFGVTLTDTADTVVYTVPANMTASLTEMALVMKFPPVGGVAADITIKIGGRNTILLKPQTAGFLHIPIRTILMPNETLMVWSSIPAVIDANISLIERSV